MKSERLNIQVFLLMFSHFSKGIPAVCALTWSIVKGVVGAHELDYLEVSAKIIMEIMIH